MKKTTNPADSQTSLLQTAERVARKVTASIENPRGFLREDKTTLVSITPVALNHADKSEIRSACFEALVIGGFFEQENILPHDESQPFRDVSRDHWKLCFSASRSAIRCDRGDRFHASLDQREADGIAHEITGADGYGYHPAMATQSAGVQAKQRANFARWIRYTNSCLVAAFKADKSRKARASFKKQVSFLRRLTAIQTGKGNLAPINPVTYRSTKKRFMEYVKTGEEILTAQATCDKATLASGKWKSFSQI